MRASPFPPPDRPIDFHAAAANTNGPCARTPAGVSPSESAEELKEKDSELSRIRKILQMNVDELELSVRSHNCLRAANIKTIADLVRRDEPELLKFRNFGRKSLAELSEIIEQFGLNFGMDVEKYLHSVNE